MEESPKYGVSGHYLAEQGEAYFTWQSKGGALQGELNRPKFDAFVDPGSDLLDFGCSDGALLAALSKAHGVGVEVNPAARRRAEAQGFVVYTSLEDIADSSVDIVVSNHTLEHVPNPWGALLELKRVLRPGGRIVLCVPAENWRASRRWRAGDVNRHLYGWTPLTLGNLLTESGYVVEDVRMLTHAWPPEYARLYRVLPARPFDAICAVWSVIRRRRQVIANAKRPLRD